MFDETRPIVLYTCLNQCRQHMPMGYSTIVPKVPMPNVVQKTRANVYTQAKTSQSEKHTHTCMYISIYIYIYMYTQHICIHTHIWIHMYIHIHYLLNCASHIVSRKLERLAWYITCWHVQGLTLADSHNWLTVSSDPFLEPVLGIHVFIELGGMHTGFL